MPAKPLRVELYAIGSELVYGLTLDTNTHWLAQQIVRLGANVDRVTKIHDDLDVIVACFRESIARGADLVISTGGLGPTVDDITNVALATLTGGSLVSDLNTIDSYVERRGFRARAELTPNFIQMALVPTTADVLPNRVGAAPALRVEYDGAIFYALAGPPREMEGLFDDHILPYLVSHTTAKTATTRLLVSLPYESRVTPYFETLMADRPGLYLKARLASTPRQGWIPVDMLVTGEDESDVQRNLGEAIDAFRASLQEDGADLEPFPDE